jgi:hypothetical protein
VEETVASFLDRAQAPERVEVVVRVHEDDPETMEWALQRRDKKRIRLLVGDTELGYGSVDHFVNGLAAVCNGDWLWPGADDHKMQTSGWDECLRTALRAPRQELLLAVARVNNWPNGKVPILSRGLYTVLGCIGRTQFADTYVDSLTHFAGLQRRIPVEVRDDGLAGGDRNALAGWAIYKGPENCWAFEQDKRKLGAVLGRSLGGWTPAEAPATP